jgi:hypothetical protein
LIGSNPSRFGRNHQAFSGHSRETLEACGNRCVLFDSGSNRSTEIRPGRHADLRPAVFGLDLLAGDVAAIRALHERREPASRFPENRPAAMQLAHEINAEERTGDQPPRAVHIHPYIYIERGWECDRAGPPRRAGPSPDETDSLHFTSCANCNLTLAARPRVRHIGRTGDVAEWLKAAVC